MIRVFIADDHAMVRGGLRQIIATCCDMQVAGEAPDGNSVLSGLKCTECDLLLLDMTMPGVSGIELIQKLKIDFPTLPILIISMHIESQFVTRAIKAGAAAYISKGSEPEVLLSAIRKVAAGGRFMDPALVDSIVFEGSDINQFPHEALSARELQILKLIAEGLPLGKIADQLYLSPKTVSTYKTRLMEKLSINNNADLIRYAYRHDLVIT